MRSAVKISVALIFLITVSVVVSLFVVPDATLRTLSGGQGELLVSVKRDVREDAANLLDDAYSAAKSVIEELSRGDIFDTLAAVEIEIPPDVLGQLRKDIRRPSARNHLADRSRRQRVHRNPKPKMCPRRKKLLRREIQQLSPIRLQSKR